MSTTEHKLPHGSIVNQKSNGFMRFIITITGIPATFVVYYISAYNFILAKSIYTIFIALMALELNQMLSKEARISPILAVLVSLVFPFRILIRDYIPVIQNHTWILSYIEKFFIPVSIVGFAIYVCFLKTNLGCIWKKLTTLVFITIYPGLLGSFYLNITNLGSGVVHFALVTGLVYSSDGLAYLIGRFFGKKFTQTNTPIISVSPNKTILGFISAITGGIIYFFIVYSISNTQFSGGIAKGVLFAIILSCAGILGDIFESAIKRSLNKKDSGVLMLGRGGVLDNFDSLLFASFVYTLVYPLMYGFYTTPIY